MTPQETLQFNKKCAEFLGWYYENNKWLKLESLNDGVIAVLKCNSDFDLKFHSDWNWIMEVVEAIEKLEFRFEFAFNEIDMYCIKDEERRYSYSINIPDFEDYGKDKHLSKKEAVVQAINQFLIWYEQYKTI